MIFSKVINRLSIVFVVCLALFVFLPGYSIAEISGPGWFAVQADPVSPEDAATYYKAQSKKQTSKQSALITMKAAVRIDNRITELARGLQNDPLLMFDYVHNHIDYVPYYGALKGSTLTLLDGSGNGFDQAALLIALLRASGYTADFVHGKMTFPAAQFDQLASWLGVDQDEQTMANVFYQNGIDVTWHSETSIIPKRVWVRLTIDGNVYLLDPAFKAYTTTSGIDLGQALDYDRDDLLGAAGGVFNDVDEDGVYESAQNINETGLQSQLEQYTANLANVISSQYPNSTVAEIIGGRSIVPEHLSQLPTTLNFTTSDEIYWIDDVPIEYTATLQVTYAGINHTFEIPNITAKRLSLTYNGSSNLPELRLDGELIATGNTSTAGNMTLTIKHPYANYNQTATFHLKSGKTYAIVSSFGGANNGLIAHRQKQLDQAIADGETDTSEPVLGETLNIMGQTWIKEVMMSAEILAKLSDTLTVRHHTVGVMAQEDRYYIDIPMGSSNKPIPRHGNTGVEDPRFRASALISSAFEHGILEQLQNNPSASTIKILHKANDEGRVINWFTDPDDSNCTQMKPDGGNLTVGSWSGMGFIRNCEYSDHSSVGMIISALSGGAGGTTGNVDVPMAKKAVQNISRSTPTSETIAKNKQITQTKPSREPVDMASGAYLYNHTDLILGGNSPTGLAFHRSYFSSGRLQQSDNSGFDHGWAHNYNIRLTEGSGGDPGLGVRSPSDMAPMIAAQKTILDLLQYEDNIKGWMISSLTAKWAIDQLIDNVVTIDLGGQSMQFVQLPNGSFISPPGITATLTKSGNIYTLQERYDRKTVFENVSAKNYRISYTEDGDGNQVNFAYTGDKLTTVSNGFGQSLTLHYTGDKINSVTDSTGRSVSYGYTGDNLTSYTDAEGKVWQYGYNDSGMTTLTNPLGITTATNTYDSFGRVKTQTVPRQIGGDKTYNFYYSGYRNAEEDPEGHQLIYHFDDKGRSIADENQLGQKVSREYDGQDHVVAATDQRGNTASFTFTGYDQTKVIDPLSHETTLLYDAEHRLTETTDPLTHKTNFGYDAEHHLTSNTIYPAAGQSISTGATFYPNGQTETATDGRSITTTFTYDAQGNPETSRLTGETPVTTLYDSVGRLKSLTDRENNTTTFTYTDLGQLETKTDPFGRVTTYTYYDDGNIHTVLDRNGDTTTSTYTPTGKIDTVSYQDGSSVHFTYDQHDRLQTMVDSLGTTTYTRDAAGRVLFVTDANGNTTGYAYDENGYTGLLTTLTYPGNKQVTYTYDELNRLKTVTNWLAQTATYVYDDAGRLATLTNFNGTVTTYSQDDANRLTGIDFRKTDNSVIASFAFTLDANGNRIGIDKQIPLTAPLPVRNETAAYTHNQLDTTSTASYVHDNEGQLSTKTEGGTTTYTFDDAYRLTGIADGTTTSYSYDGAGNRLRAVRNGTETRYIYDAAGNLLAEADSNNSITRYYIHGAGLLAAVTPADAVYCYHYDGVGSTVAITDSTQSVVNSYTYSPFGMLLNETEDFSQPFKYVGKLGVMSEGSGFYYMRARYYDPITGRFISEDPLGFGGGDVNLMVYAGSNPVLLVDPFGLKTWQIGFGFNFGGITGTTKSAGLIIGHNPDTGKWDLGSYVTGGAGLHGGASASLTLDITTSDNSSINDVSGWAGTAGGSVGEFYTIGYERNTPISDTLPSNTYSFGVGAGIPAEGHGYATHTSVWGCNQ